MSWWSNLFQRAPVRGEALALVEDAPIVVTEKRRPLPSAAMEFPLASLGSDFKTVNQIKGAIHALDGGDFRLPSMLLRQMLWNGRLRGLFDLRLAGLVGTETRWEPGRQNASGRKAALAIVEDWPLIVSPATRKQLHRNGLALGAGFAQKHWYVSPTTGRAIPRVQVFDPAFANWIWIDRVYRFQTMDGPIDFPSPALSAPTDFGLTSWVIHEPYGARSWLEGIIHAAWNQWFALNSAGRDMARGCEKFGLGIVKAFIPTNASGEGYAEEVKAFVNAFRKLGSEGTLPCADRGSDFGKFDAQPLEFSATGHEIIKTTRDAAGVDLAILILGNPATTDASATTFASASVGNDVRGDLNLDDLQADNATCERQIVREWALANFGDPELAPRRIDVTDPPTMNLATAQAFAALAPALAQIKAVEPRADVVAMLERFRFPLLPEIVAVPVAETITPAAPVGDAAPPTEKPAP